MNYQSVQKVLSINCERFREYITKVETTHLTNKMKLNSSQLMNKSNMICAARPIKSKFLPLLVCLGLPLTAVADEKVVLPSTTIDHLGISPSLGGPIQLAPFKYIPPAGAVNKVKQPGIDLPKRSPDQLRLVELSAIGDYQAVGSQGLVLMVNAKLDDELQLMIANSLAWTGRLKEAMSIYQVLTKGEFAKDANIGMANIQRWSGRDDQAAPIFRSVLAIDPGNADALEGLALSERELSPRTTLSFGGSSDSSDMQRRSTIVNHRWRDSSGTNIYEVETSKVRDALPTSEASQQDVTVRYQNLSVALKPSLELSMPTQENRALFGSLRINLYDDRVSLQAGRINWGKLATNPNALASGLTASHAALSAGQNFSFGMLTGRVNYYDISDGNTIVTSNLNVDSSWRPLGNNLKPFFGVETRHAKFNRPNYWSPDSGFGVAYVGLKSEWNAADWSLFTAGQVNAPFWGEAGNGWNVSAGGKRWFSNDMAISMNIWAMASHRDNTAYRAQGGNLNLEKLWK